MKLTENQWGAARLAFDRIWGLPGIHRHDALKFALASIPEQGALTDAELVSWIDENWPKYSSEGKYCRAASEAGCRAMFYAFRTWFAARRPTPAPEPKPQKDDAAVVEEMCKAADDCTESDPSFEYCGMRAARAVAIRGMVTLEEVEKALTSMYAAHGMTSGLEGYIADFRARLTAAPKPTKQERTRAILEKYRPTSTPLEAQKEIIAELVAELEAQNGK
jgi:hypothetical protein